MNRWRLVCAAGLMWGWLGGTSAVPGADDLRLELPRYAFFRGESVPLKIHLAREPKPAAASRDGSAAKAVAQVEVFFDETSAARAEAAGDVVSVAVPTADFKVGAYRLKAVVSRASGETPLVATQSVRIVRRPPTDRLEIWLWGVGGLGGDFYLDRGFTIAGGPAWHSWNTTGRGSEAFRQRMIKHLDDHLARGFLATIGPCGGIVRRDFKDTLPTGDDTAYRGAERNDERYFNPFSPEVDRLRREANRRFMEEIGGHPALKVAFFNTEVVDDIRLDNLNREGVELTRRALGFARNERGRPKFTAPGVLPDDDRGYRYRNFTYREGSGLAYVNRRTAEDVKQTRPDIRAVTDPFRSAAITGTFPGLDMVGTWTYVFQDPKLMLYVESMRAVTRDSGQQPLNVITLLNYPGTLAPRDVTIRIAAAADKNDKHGADGWMMMSPDPCKEVSWIVLSRAPKIIGYYFGSFCDPRRYNRPSDQFRVPQASLDAITEMSRRVYMPYGPLLTRLDVAKRRIAVVSSQASQLYGKAPRTLGYPNQQIYAFYSLLAMNHRDGDVLFDDQVAAGALKDYDVLVLPRCEVVTQSMHAEILKFARRGGCVIADQYLGFDVPGAIKFDFDFGYRTRVNADAIISGVSYAEWDDHLKPKTAALAPTKGVTAEEDRKIMEAYARRLAQGIAGKVKAPVELDSPRALVNVLEKDGVQYLVLINDNRAYGERLGKYEAVLEKLVPQTVGVVLNDRTTPVYAYDLLERKALAVKPGPRPSFQVDLTELGGKIVALYPVRPAKLAIVGPKEVRRGDSCHAAIEVHDEAGRTLPGLQPLRVTVTDAGGRETEYGGYCCAERGRLRLPLTPAGNDAPGVWKIAVEDLTAGLKSEKMVDVR